MDSIRLDPDRPSLDAKNLDKLIERWLEDRRRRLPTATANGYTLKIRYFRDWWREHGPLRSWTLDEDVLLDFNKHLVDHPSRYGQPLGFHTRKDCLRRLRQMFHWAYRNGYIANDYGKLVPAAEGSTPLRIVAPLDCLHRLIQAAEQAPYPLRDRAILAILLGTGVRRAECASIHIEWVHINADSSGDLQVDAKKVSKRDIHRRTVAFDAATGKYIRDYLDSLTATNGPLFRARQHNGRLSPMGVYRVVKQLITLAGLDGQIQGPHDLRRYFATYYSRYRRGENYGHLLSKQLGHSSYRMTARYSLQDVEDIREALISPFAILEEKTEE